MTPTKELLARLDFLTKDDTPLHLVNAVPIHTLCDAAALIRSQAAQLEAERRARKEAEQLINAVPAKEHLMHKRACAAFHEPITGTEVNAEQCTCGLRYRIQTQTAETVSRAWRERATLAESRLVAMFERTREKIRSPLFQQFIKQGFWHAHHVDLVWRMDGKDITEQADWLKDLWYYIRALQPESAAQAQEQLAKSTGTRPVNGMDKPGETGLTPASAAAISRRCNWPWCGCSGNRADPCQEHIGLMRPQIDRRA